jgi:hypothetical protein
VHDALLPLEGKRQRQRPLALCRQPHPQSCAPPQPSHTSRHTHESA